MNTQIVRKARTWIGSAILLAGISYAALTLTIKPTYAASCDCVEARQDAEEICAAEGSSLKGFGCNPSQDHFIFQCANGNDNDVPCSF